MEKDIYVETPVLIIKVTEFFGVFSLREILFRAKCCPCAWFHELRYACNFACITVHDILYLSVYLCFPAIK